QVFVSALLQEMPESGGIIGRILSWLVAFLAISAAYLYTFPQPNIPYAAFVLLHTAAGILVSVLIVPALFRLLRSGGVSGRIGWLLILAGSVAGLILIKTGTPRSEWSKLYLHIVLSMAGVGLLIADWLDRRSSAARASGSPMISGVARAVICLAVLAGLGYVSN